MIDKLTIIIYRTFFIIALVLLLIALWEKILQYFGWTISCILYQPGRILEFSAIFMIFVIALLLRQIRGELKK